ncbi:MAG: hypothetical protein ABJH07_25675, partial [Sedimentitalea sp.]|uniref:hypothetical protein n=1 Tax=Sedimentitalea sp. TaxID=2048915 RepID=UPI00326737A8
MVSDPSESVAAGRNRSFGITSVGASVSSGTVSGRVSSMKRSPSGVMRRVTRVDWPVASSVEVAA